MWLAAHNVSRFAAARAISCDYKMIGLWADGRALPSLVYAYKIDAFTSGGVPPESWLGTELAKLIWNNNRVDWPKLNRQRLEGQHRRRLARGQTEG